MTKKNTRRHKISQELAEILQLWTNSEKKITLKENTNLVKKFAIDSIAILQTVLAIEKKYNIKFENSELNIKLFTKAGNLITLIESKINETN